MKLINQSRKTIVSPNLKKAILLSDQLLGLLKKSNPRSLLFKTRFGIHTFFLKEPIDVIILDNNFKVIGIHKSLKPYRILFWNPKFSLVLELPEHSIDNSQTMPGDLLVVTQFIAPFS